MRVLSFIGNAFKLSNVTGKIPGEIFMAPGSTAPAGSIKANGAVIPVASYPDLVTNRWCGASANATAEWDYRCTDDEDPENTRSDTGDYFVTVDARAEFFRGWDDGRGVDSGRSLWAWQDFASKVRADGWNSVSSPSGGDGGALVGHDPSVQFTGIYSSPTGLNDVTSKSELVSAFDSRDGRASETRSRNIPALFCIWYE